MVERSFCCWSHRLTRISGHVVTANQQSEWSSSARNGAAPSLKQVQFFSKLTSRVEELIAINRLHGCRYQAAHILYSRILFLHFRGQTEALVSVSASPGEERHYFVKALAPLR